ncbi:uncharacterized protein [Triticum aestivum]|uniref:uncharacterized protein isoform X2 n=1 Tax=Triticum aestivum TaxID=4565 RepID=UPI001D0314D9|nr:uncharacterized protein LOC123079110 isoform X2 [Triticum aestivum]XP_044357722.1 uncharacterized protein LOC123079110 isoform X2 [Triticum aestivum]XP_044357723.1 uncharacterized protein LOC123079110 isoform X2 [Triticum aestivum]
MCVCASCFTYDSEKELLCRLPTSRISYLWSGATKQFMRKYVEAPNVFHLQFPPWTPPRSWAPPPPTRAPTGSTGWASPSWASATTAASSPLTLRTSTGTPPSRIQQQRLGRGRRWRIGHPIPPVVDQTEGMIKSSRSGGRDFYC